MAVNKKVTEVTTEEKVEETTETEVSPANLGVKRQTVAAEPNRILLTLAPPLQRLVRQGILFQKEEAYSFDQADAMDLLTETDDYGRLVWAVYKPAKPKVVAEKDGPEVHYMKKTTRIDRVITPQETVTTVQKTVDLTDPEEDAEVLEHLNQVAAGKSVEV